MKVEQYRREIAGKKRTKYGNRVTGGYASKDEANRAADLKFLQQTGAIFALREQPRYVLIDKSAHGPVIHYAGDFEYIDSKTGQTICEDVKPPRSRDGAGKLRRAVQSRDFPLRFRLAKERYPDIEFRLWSRESNKNWKHSDGRPGSR